jgi:acyl-coenzyme A synthetase/AMP-(fatty) acid ligase
MTNIYDAQAGDVFWAASDVGWVVGHSYIVYGPLLQGCTSVLFEGKPIRTPDAATFWRVVEQHKVNIMFTAPTAIRAIKKEDDAGKGIKKHNLSSLKYLFLAGERCDPATYLWIKELLNIPVVDHWWQTESGWPMLGLMMGLEKKDAKVGSANLPVCGFSIDILEDDGRTAIANEEGNIVVKLPLPPGCLPTLWNDDEGFKNTYLNRYPGYYLTGDGGYKDNDDYFFVMGRIDDVINVAGHRLSTGEIEEVLASHSSIAECAVVGIGCELKGQKPVGFIVLKDGAKTKGDKLIKETIALVRDQIGPVASYKDTVIVPRLPKTRSGKILRKIMRFIADGKPFTVPSTIDDPAILKEIEHILAENKIGFAFEK